MTNHDDKTKATDATGSKDAVAEIRLLYGNHSVGFSGPAEQGISKALWKPANKYICERNEAVVIDIVEPKTSRRGDWTDMFEGGRRVTTYWWEPDPKVSAHEENTPPQQDGRER